MKIDLKLIHDFTRKFYYKRNLIILRDNNIETLSQKIYLYLLGHMLGRTLVSKHGKSSIMMQ